MTPDRLTAPKTHAIEHIQFPKAGCHKTANGIDIHFINDDQTEVLKLEFVFDAGSRNQKQPYQATATNALLIEGTSKFSSKDLADNLDYYGAYIQNRAGADDASLVLYCLPKHLNACLPYLLAILSDANYPEQELITQKQNAIQRLLVNENKGSYLCRRAFYQTIFGNTNSYGMPVYQEDISNISRETLVEYYNEHYRNKVKYLFVSGKVDPSLIHQLEGALSGFGLSQSTSISSIAQTKETQKIFVHKDKAVQSAIRIGRSFVNRTHADYRKMQVLNMVLGGYFGSRLMTNIREEKGLTYGIYSVVESYLGAGSFYIETEINNELVELGLKEIYSEIKKLRESPIGKSELDTVKNYMLGSFIRSVDGPFSLADRHKILIDYALPSDYYDEFIEIIQSIDSLALQELANTYLQEKDLNEIVVGEK